MVVKKKESSAKVSPNRKVNSSNVHKVINGLQNKKLVIVPIDESYESDMEEEHDVELGRVELVNISMEDLVRNQQNHLFEEIADMKMDLAMRQDYTIRTNLINILDIYPKAKPEIPRSHKSRKTITVKSSS